MMPPWLQALATVSLALGLLSAIAVAVDLARGHPQHMNVMNVVWPVTALWSGPLGAWAYFRYGRAGARDVVMAAKARGTEPPNVRQSFPVLVAKGATHCGSGCALADIAAEWLVLAVPLYVFGKAIFGAWVYDFVLAFVLGIVFQYFTIKPMRRPSRREGLVAALEADAASLTAWQVGMYGWMAIATFAIFHHELRKTDPVFWFMMQIGMFFGFATSFPVNWLLLRKGLEEKEKM